MICVDESAVDVYTTCYHVNALEVACESTTLHVSITLVILVGTVSAFSSC